MSFISFGINSKGILALSALTNGMAAARMGKENHLKNSKFAQKRRFLYAWVASLLIYLARYTHMPRKIFYI